MDVPRGGRLDWAPLRTKIAAQGMRNSNVLAIASTATISNIIGTSPCIQPLYKNLFVKANLSGEFVVLNHYLVRDLKAAGIWSRELAGQLKYFDGDLAEIGGIPEELRERYRTAFEIDSAFLIEAAAWRQKWIDQSQSLNLFLAQPDLKTLSHMYRHGWRAGLKTTYYLRTLGASTIEKATVAARQERPPRRLLRRHARSRRRSTARSARPASDDRVALPADAGQRYDPARHSRVGFAAESVVPVQGQGIRSEAGAGAQR